MTFGQCQVEVQHKAPVGQGYNTPNLLRWTFWEGRDHLSLPHLSPTTPVPGPRCPFAPALAFRLPSALILQFSSLWDLGLGLRLHNFFLSQEKGEEASATLLDVRTQTFRYLQERRFPSRHPDCPGRGGTCRTLW